MDGLITRALAVALEVRPGGAKLDNDDNCVRLFPETSLRFASQPKNESVAHITVAYRDGNGILLKHKIAPRRKIKVNKGLTTEVLYVSVEDCTPAFLKDCFISRLKAI